VREVMPDNTLRGIEIYGFEADGRLAWIRAARQADWRGGRTWGRTTPGNPLTGQCWDL